MISITLLTQLPILLPYNKIFKFPLIFMWLVLVLHNIRNGIAINNNIIKKLSIIAVFNIWILFISIYDIRFLNSYHFITINLSFIFLLAGYTAKEIYKEPIEFYITKYTSIITFFITISIYIEYYSGKELNSVQSYVYTSKNSIGGLVIISFILLDNINRNYKFNSIMKYTFQVWFIIFILLLQHRAGMVSIATYILITKIPHILKSKINNKKIIIIALIILFICIFWIDITNMVRWALRIDNVKNLNDFSSGRVELIINAIESFKVNSLIGTPTYYVDNLFVCLLAEYGIIGSSILFLYFLLITVDLFKLRKKSGNLLIKLCIPISLLAFFEALAPFGPGGIYCVFWFIYGINIRSHRRI